MGKLTAKQKDFIKAYLQCLCGTRAVIKAYPGVKNRNTAGVMAYELLANSRIRMIIDDQLDKDNCTSRFKDFEIYEKPKKEEFMEKVETMYFFKILFEDIECACIGFPLEDRDIKMIYQEAKDYAESKLRIELIKDEELQQRLSKKNENKEIFKKGV